MARLKSIDMSIAASDLRSKAERWRLFKLPFEGNMFLNMAFFYGFQWTLYNLATAELQEVDNPAGNIRLTSNQIQPRVRNLHAKMTKNRPIVDTTATEFTDEALFSSRVSRALLDQWREDMDEDELDAETIDWLLLCGTAFRKIGYDPEAGDSLQIDMEAYSEYVGMNPGTEMSQFQMPEGGGVPTKNIPMGDIFDEVVPPFEILLPPYVQSFYAAPEVIHEKIMTLDDVRNKWGRKAKDAAPNKDIKVSNQFQRRLLGMANPDVGNAVGYSEALLKDDELLWVRESWSKPMKGWPNGRAMIVLGDMQEPVFYDENPYYKALNKIGIRGGIPFIQFKCINAPGRAWDISPVEALRPLQVEYNKCISDIIQNRATVGRNKIMAPKTSNIDRDELANIHGQFIEYSGIIPPQIIPAVPLPQQVEREIDRNRSDMDTVSGSHEVSRAEVPSGVKSGIAINYLLEQDDTTLAPIIQYYERSKKRLAKGKLALAQQFYVEDRTLKASHSESEVDVMMFRGTDLTTNIRIVPGSAMPRSRAAMQAMILDMFERNAIIDDMGMPDPQKLFRLLRDSLPLEGVADDQNLDLDRARRENIRMAGGEPIAAMHWENHKLHMMEHNRYRKSERFYQLSPEIQKVFDQHVMIHMNYMMPPTVTPGAAQALGLPPAGMGAGLAPGGNGDTARKSPSFMGQGVMGQLNNPPSNKGGTFGGS